MKTIEKVSSNKTNPHEFDQHTLKFFRERLDEFTLEIFKQVFISNQNDLGLIKTRLPNYINKRKSYDAAFLILESIGFIEKSEDGARTPYYTTVRGVQLAQLLTNEAKTEGKTNE